LRKILSPSKGALIRALVNRIDARHRNISADFVASHMYPHKVKTPEYAPKAIISAIEEKFGYTIGYGKAPSKEEGVGAWVGYL
jgi:HD superfamily phosphodiesterase